MDARVASIAVRQHGIVGRRQLIHAGMSPRTVDVLLERGKILRVSRGVYRVAGAPLTSHGELVAAVLRCGPGAVVAGERLLAHVGVRTADPAGPFVVLTRPGRTVTGVDWCVRTNRAPGRELAEVAGVASVTPALSLFESAVHRSDADVERLVDGSRWQGSILGSLPRVAAAYPDHPGVRRLLASGLIDEGAPESPPERGVASLLIELGAKTQVWVTAYARADFYFPGAKLVVEYDGRGGHTGPRNRERDGARDAALRALGFAVIRLRKEEVADLAALRVRIAGLLQALAGR